MKREEALLTIDRVDYRNCYCLAQEIVLSDPWQGLTDIGFCYYDIASGLLIRRVKAEGMMSSELHGLV